jgi:small subunit ribosomal protein S17
MVKKKNELSRISDKPKNNCSSDSNTLPTSEISKILIKTKRYMAHDEQNQCKAGDLVLLEESPPYSRHKNGH